MTSLRIVLVTPKAPDPFGSAPAGWYYLVARGLTERGHRVTCFSAYQRPIDAERARAALKGSSVNLQLFEYPTLGLLESKWKTLRRPYSYFISNDLERAVAGELRRGYDVFHLDDIWAGYLGCGVPRAVLFLHHLLRLDFHAPDNDATIGRRWLACTAERRIIREFRHVRVESDRMAAEVRRVHAAVNVLHVPCAIDTSLYPFEAPRAGPPTIGFVASMNWHLGRNAAERLMRRVWPLVKARVPEAQLLIVGWAARRALAPYLDQPGVTILENVPAVEPFFRTLSALTYPLSSGSGMKVKVLEAMAYGVPVVTTTPGMEGIDAVDGVHAHVTDDDDVFVEKTVALLRSLELRQTMARAARALVDDTYSTGTTVRRLEQAYQSLC